MFDFLFQELQKNSILLILLSSVIGGFIGATLKLVFEVVLADRYKQRRQAKFIIDKYSNPIVSTADALRGRIANFLQGSDQNWFDKSEYYRLSTLYVFCAYFAWVEILFGNLTRIRYLTSKRNRRLHRILNAIDKAFNNRDYFYPIYKTRPSEEIDEIPKFICKALGEQTIDNSTADGPSCLSFSDFCMKYANDSEYHSWVKNLEKFLTNIKEEYGNLKWDRMHIIQLSLIALTNFLDPKHEQSRNYKSSVTKLVLNRIKYQSANEQFSMDVVRYNLPIIVESRKRIFRRKVLLLRGKQPILQKRTSTKRPSKKNTEFDFDATTWDLSNGKSRFSMYKTINRIAVSMTNELPYGTLLSCNIILEENQVQDDILERIPSNISNMSMGRIPEKNVNIKFQKSEDRIIMTIPDS